MGGAETYSVSHLYYHENGYIFAAIGSLGKITPGGTFWNQVHGDAWGDYFKFYNWEQENPYNVETVFCIYVQEDQRVLIGGAIATDTLQPYLFRNLCRLLPDGSHDTSFPAVEAEPNNPYTYISEISPDNEGKWYVSGNFTGINGHSTNYIARLNQDFSVDESFTSPFQFTSFPAIDPRVIFVDDLNRVWISGYKMVLENSPTDTMEVVRLFPDATIDESFLPRRLYSNYPPEWVYRNSLIIGVKKLEEEEDHYLLHGQFNIFNDTIQNCITVVDDSGYIQPHYFPGTAADSCHWSFSNTNPGSYYEPTIANVTELEDGSLILGGAFSHFDGQEHYNVVKLNKGIFSSVREHNFEVDIQVFPNPAEDKIHLRIPDNTRPEKVEIFDALGKPVFLKEYSQRSGYIQIENLPAGIYLLRATFKDQKVGKTRFVKRL